MACMPRPDSPVDTASSHSVSFAPPHLSRPTPPTDPWLPLVGTEHPAPTGPFSHGALGDGMNGYPIQPAKVQRPTLRDETLARDRLLDWLAAKIHQRVILVLADAGYGKTTLLADFSRRTRLRTLWYRLDEDDRDWISFLSHLVAAGREHDATFAPTTGALAQRSGHGRADEGCCDPGLPARAALDHGAGRRAHPRRLPPRR